MRVIRVLVADDHRLIREALRLALAAEADLEVVAEAADGSEVLPRVEQSRPDLVLLDVRMPGMDGIETLVRLRERYPALKVVMLSAVDEPEVADEALACGAAAYLGKRVDPLTVASTLRAIANGGVVKRSVGVSRKAAAGASDGARLSAREREIVSRVAAGRSNKEIARELWVSEQTVKYHLTNVYRKLGVGGRAEAARFAFENGLAGDLSRPSGRAN
jgi:DNA-binding NarL/FixJ family response regulator